MKLSDKLLVTALAIGFVPVSIIGGVMWYQSQKMLSNQSFNHLESVRELKKNQLENFFLEKERDMEVLLDIIATLRQNAFQKLETVQENKKSQLEWYFSEILNDVSLLAESYTISQALHQFGRAFQLEEKNVEGLAYLSTEDRFGLELKRYQQIQGYHDLMLITQEGDVVYTVTKGPELGQNVFGDNLEETPLAQAAKKGLHEVTLQDFKKSALANDQYIAFISAPVSHFGSLTGTLVLSFSPEAINAIVHQRKGMGRTSTTYLVGKAEDQSVYRSDRITDGQVQAVFNLPKEGQDVEQVLAGESGLAVRTNYSGDLILGAYSPLQVRELNWGIISTIELEELLTPKLIGESEDFFSQYIDKYGFYDLFLIHPEGKIFYTVKHEADYNTNILTGKYAQSQLGLLIKEVLQTKRFGISDYELYSPSYKQPSAFIAQPLLHDEHVELIVALQLDDSSLNKVMLQRAGMGDTGETYLVGGDYLMRSNSSLAKTHSIKASFEKPATGSVDTESSRAALDGQTGEIVTQNYLGQTVLSAYTPLTVGRQRWALIADIHQTEAFAAIKRMEWILGVLVLLVTLITFIFIKRFTYQLVKPLLSINDHLKKLAKGQIVEYPISYAFKDEIGEIVRSSQRLKESVYNTITQANAIAAGDYSQEVQLLSEQDQLGLALSNMTLTLREVTKKNTIQDWLKTGQNQLNEQMSGEQDIVNLTHNIISFITLYVEAQIGVCYLIEQKDSNTSLNQKIQLKLVASYAYTRRKNLTNEFQFSDGLVERAAGEQQRIILTINEGLETEIPRHLVLLPFLHETMVKGVLVLGATHIPTPLQLDFLDQVMPSIGIAVNAIESRSKMQALLQQTQTQAQELHSQKERLQYQTEELQHQKEELQSQTEELQSQSEELQSQTEELPQSNEELEERTRELERQRADIDQKNQDLEKSKQLIQAKADELELASRYKSEFLANMSHELRTPLNSLLILAQLLAENKQGNLTDKQQEYAKTIHNAGSDLLSLINDILDLSKVEAGKMVLQADQVSLADLFELIDQKFRPMADHKKITFQMELAAEVPPSITTDLQRLKQILNNLLSNAFKFTAQGEVKLTVQRPTEHEVSPLGLKAAHSIAIHVTDSGIGIPNDKQKLIFEAFQQVDGTTSRRYGGTGLGLSISRQLARLLGGEISLQSQEGSGSTFTLYLPETLSHSGTSTTSTPTVAPTQPTSSPSTRDIPLVSPSASEEPISHIEQTVTHPTETFDDDRETLKPTDKSILIVEDDRKFSRILMELGREKNFKCLVAEDGQTGLQLAQEYHPNAIILDVGLPKIDGWTVMDKLKDNPDTRHIPVHFMSAFDQGQEALQKGAIGHLLKPVSMAELGTAFKKIERFISKTVRTLLLFSDEQQHQQEILDLVHADNVQATVAISKEDAFQQLQKTTFDCIIVDIDAEQQTAIELLEPLHQIEKLAQIPVIIYANRDLSHQEETLLQQSTNNLTVKSVRSPERLLDETTLFLHQIEAQLPKEKRHMLQMVHDKEAILRNKKVLIVDDDMRNTFALATVLEDKEMEVIGANNGKEALAILEDQADISLILMDIMMPEMDGYETMRQIRKQTRFRKLPIIALTAKAMKGDKAKCIEAGANDYLSKPVDKDKLISLMRVWLYR